MTQRIVLTTILASLVLPLSAVIYAAEPNLTTSHPTRCESPYRKKPVPPKQLRAIVESHGQWLEHREKPEYQRANLCQADLRRAKLAGTNLERARLEGTVLPQANLYENNLSQTNLSQANLQEANLRGATFSEADLTGAATRRSTSPPRDVAWSQAWFQSQARRRPNSIRPA